MQCVALQLAFVGCSLQCIVDLGALTRNDTFSRTMRTDCFVLWNTMCGACANLGWEMTALSQCAWNAARLTQNKLRRVTRSSTTQGFIISLRIVDVLFWGCEEEGRWWSRNFAAWKWQSLLTAHPILRGNILPFWLRGKHELPQSKGLDFPVFFKFEFQLDHTWTIPH